MAGDTVIPGMIELHTDHLESHFAPRPHVRWHALSAVMAYDAQIASAGITTVFDSLRVGSDPDATEVGKDLVTLAGALTAARATGHLRAEHLTHLRCEIASPDVLEQAEDYAARYPIDLMSLMDHTPGQRQFRDLATWRRFYAREISMSSLQVDEFIRQRIDLHTRNADRHRRKLVALARKTGAILASHDDATRGSRRRSRRIRRRGRRIPDDRRGGPRLAPGRHQGDDGRTERRPRRLAFGQCRRRGAGARRAARHPLLRLCSRQPAAWPRSSCRAACRRSTSPPPSARSPSPRRRRPVSPTAARIAIGKRADLVRVSLAAGTPIVRQVWRQGIRVA